MQCLTDGAFPNLCGPGVKAASTRAVLPFAALLAREMLDRDPSEERAARLSSIERLLRGEGDGGGGSPSRQGDASGGGSAAYFRGTFRCHNRGSRAKIPQLITRSAPRHAGDMRHATCGATNLAAYLGVLRFFLFLAVAAQARLHKAAEALAALSALLDAAPMFLTAAQQQSVADLVHKHLINWAWLSQRAISAGRVEFNLTPKHHYFAHLPEVCSMINPSFARNYSQENFVGLWCRIYAATKSGAWGSGIQRATLGKYLLSLQLALRTTP